MKVTKFTPGMPLPLLDDRRHIPTRPFSLTSSHPSGFGDQNSSPTPVAIREPTEDSRIDSTSFEKMIIDLRYSTSNDFNLLDTNFTPLHQVVSWQIETARSTGANLVKLASRKSKASTDITRTGICGGISREKPPGCSSPQGLFSIDLLGIDLVPADRLHSCGPPLVPVSKRSKSRALCSIVRWSLSRLRVLILPYEPHYPHDLYGLLVRN
ncbi:hypothetical protein V8E53_000842 [Lactarius tabidus]